MFLFYCETNGTLEKVGKVMNNIFFLNSLLELNFL